METKIFDLVARNISKVVGYSESCMYMSSTLNMSYSLNCILAVAQLSHWSTNITSLYWPILLFCITSQEIHVNVHQHEIPQDQASCVALHERTRKSPLPICSNED